MKKFLHTLIIGGIGGALFLMLLGGVFYKLNFLSLAKIINIWIPSRTIIREVEKEVVMVSLEEQVSRAIRATEESMVAVKSYDHGNLWRFGSGIVVTQDGIIVTTTQVVPPEAQTYQVLFQDQIWTATVIYRDPARRLAVIKVPTSSLKPARLDCRDLEVGRTLYMVGRLSPLKKMETFAYKAFISRLLSPDKIMIEGDYGDYLNGSGLVNADGKFCGLVYIDGQRIWAWRSALIEDIIDNHLK